jgi:TatD DNase family protein
LPLDRVLTETDHPFGDRGRPSARPGAVEAVEAALASHHRLTEDAVRLQVWRNLGRLAAEAGCIRLLPTRVQALLGTVS